MIVGGWRNKRPFTGTDNIEVQIWRNITELIVWFPHLRQRKIICVIYKLTTLQ